MNSKLKCALGASVLALASAPAFAAECGDVSIAEMDWASAEMMANVDAIILEEGYGCNVELIPGATTTTFASMSEKGQPDVAPELWINAVREPLAKAVSEGSMLALNGGPITDLGEGWWITPAFAEKHPELNTVEKVLEHPELFPYAEDEFQWSGHTLMALFGDGSPGGSAIDRLGAFLYRARCEPAPNSTGKGALIGVSGSVSIADDDFHVTARDCPPGVFGMFFYGLNETRAPLSNGWRCVGPGVCRTVPVAVDTSGSSLHLRGWRRHQGRAPLAETIAAGAVRVAGIVTP